MKWMYFSSYTGQPLLFLLLLIAATNARPNGAHSETAQPQSTPATAPTPAPTVSTVLANDTAIANKFIDNLNLTDVVVPVSITNRRLHSISHNLAAIGKVQTNILGDNGSAKVHHGVAVPMTMEELEAEMARDTPKPVNVKQTLRTKIEPTAATTAKDGITTWIPADAPTVKPTMAGTQQKMDKIAKIKVDAEPIKPSKTNKVKFIPSSPKGTTTTTTTPQPTTTTKTTTSAAVTKAQPVKKKASPTRPSTSTSTTTTTTTEANNEVPTDLPTETPPTTTAEPDIVIITTTKETPVPFLILEAKDAEFNLPQDRSPGKPNAAAKKPKRPLKSGNKKKQANKNKTSNAAAANKDEIDEADVSTKNSTKLATTNNNNKLKQKPMTTQIYNYLQREIMPTVGVGLLGLMVTAGIAGYFLNPLGALRRSYEVADRKDDLYHYNNEEYAGPGQSDGQSEEEIFGKVIAGMPAHSTYRNNIRYGQPPAGPPQQQHRTPNQFKQQQFAASAGNPQYSRYRNVQHVQHAQQAPQLQQQQQHPGHYAAYAGHYGQQRNNQLNPNVLIQKSNAAPMYTYSLGGGGNHNINYQQQPQQQLSQSPAVERVVTAPPPPAAVPFAETVNASAAQQQQIATSTAPAVSAASTATADDEDTPTISSSTASAPSIVYSYTDKSYTDQYLDTNPNELKRRSQFVVGSSVVLADAQAAALTAAEPSKYPSIVLPEHGPRRRRRRAPRSLTAMLAVPADIVDAAEDTADIVEGRTFDLNIGDADAMYDALRRRYEGADGAAARADKQILKEMKRLDYQVTRLRRVVAEAKDIEQFQSELSLEPKNGELHETLNNGMVQISSDIRFVNELLDDPRMAGEKIAERAQMSKRMALKAVVPAATMLPKVQKTQVLLVAADRADGEADGDVVAGNEVQSAKKATPSTQAAATPIVPSTTAASTTTTTSYAHSIEYTTTPQPTFFLGLLKMLELKSAFGVNVLRSIRPAFDRAVADVFRVNQTMYNHN